MKREKIEEEKMQPLGLLYNMFETIQKEFSIEEDEEVYKRLIEIFGDVCRLSPMPLTTRPICDTIKLINIYEFIKQSQYYHKKEKIAWDYFGRLYESIDHLPEPDLFGKTKKKVQGINLTPEWLVQFINRSCLGSAKELTFANGNKIQFIDKLKKSKKISEKKPLMILDPTCGTGRFLLDTLKRNLGYHKQIVCGIEKDLWLYRTCLVNCTTYFPFGIWKVLCADSLVNDCAALFQDSNIVNQWHVPHWKKLKMRDKFAEELFQNKQTELTGFSNTQANPSDLSSN